MENGIQEPLDRSEWLAHQNQGMRALSEEEMKERARVQAPLLGNMPAEERMSYFAGVANANRWAMQEPVNVALMPSLQDLSKPSLLRRLLLFFIPKRKK